MQPIGGAAHEDAIHSAVRLGSAKIVALRLRCETLTGTGVAAPYLSLSGIGVSLQLCNESSFPTGRRKPQVCQIWSILQHFRTMLQMIADTEDE